MPEVVDGKISKANGFIYDYGTIDLNVKMIRPMQVDTSYYATAELINAGRNIISTEGKIVDENGKVYAFASATLMIIRK